MQLRNQIARFQHDNPTMQVYGTAETNSTFQQYIYEEKDAALDDYTFLMTNSAVYGGAFEIDAFSKIYGKRVIVYVQNGKKWTPWLVIGKDCGEENIVRLGYLNLAGGSNNNHYVRLVLGVIGTEALRAKEAAPAESPEEHPGGCVCSSR